MVYYRLTCPGLVRRDCDGNVHSFSHHGGPDHRLLDLLSFHAFKHNIARRPLHVIRFQILENGDDGKALVKGVTEGEKTGGNVATDVQDTEIHRSDVVAVRLERKRKSIEIELK